MNLVEYNLVTTNNKLIILKIVSNIQILQKDTWLTNSSRSKRGLCEIV